MRKWCLICFILAALLLVGCGEGQVAGEEDRALAALNPTAPPKQEDDLAAFNTQAQSRPLTDDEILSAYNRAVTAYGWFERTTLPCLEDTEVTIDGYIYRRVDSAGIDSMEDLRTNLQGLFSTELTEQLLATGEEHPFYLDVEGVLYGFTSSRKSDIHKTNIETEVEQVSDTAYCINVTADLLDTDLLTVIGIECHSFPYELSAGRWVFSEFHLIR